MCVHQYADLVSNMTVRVMQNTPRGDTRVKNALADFLDRTPSKVMNRKTFVYWIVETLFTAGDGNAVVLPVYDGDLLTDLVPVDPASVIFEQTTDADRYRIRIGGQVFTPDEVLHFRINPDLHTPWLGRGYRISLRQVVDAIEQAGRTKDALMRSPAPSLVVQVDALSEDMATPEGRERIANQYIQRRESGSPWIIPADLLKINEVRPLSIADLAIKDNLELDRKKVACLLGVPPFTVGVGDYKDDVYNYFVNQGVRGIAMVIEQELTRKLIWSDEWHVQLNPRSLYNYKLGELVTAGKELVDRAAMRRNELRDWIGLSPDDEMNDVFLLENYLPTDRLGDQKKLNKKGGEGDGD